MILNRVFLVLIMGVVVTTLVFPFHPVAPSSLVPQPQPQPQPQQQPALLITNQTSGLKTYENPVYGFAFDFPLDWQIDMPTTTTNGGIQSGSSLDKEIIGVESAESASRPAWTPRTGFTVSVSDVSTYLDPESLQVKALNAADYANIIIPITESDSDIVSSAPTTLANETNAWRREYIMTLGGAQIAFVSEIFVIKDNTLYHLSYSTNPLSVPENLPMGKKIMESFRFI